MTDFTKEELLEAKKALDSTLNKCEKINVTRLGSSQATLLKRRINALKIALTLIAEKLRAYEPG